MKKLEINTLGKFWSICTNCEEWNWCDLIPFTHVPICRVCFEVEVLPKLKAQKVLQQLIKKFFKGFREPPEHKTTVE